MKLQGTLEDAVQSYSKCLEHKTLEYNIIENTKKDKMMIFNSLDDYCIHELLTMLTLSAPTCMYSESFEEFKNNIKIYSHSYGFKDFLSKILVGNLLSEIQAITKSVEYNNITYLLKQLSLTQDGYNHLLYYIENNPIYSVIDFEEYNNLNYPIKQLRNLSLDHYIIYQLKDLRQCLQLKNYLPIDEILTSMLCLDSIILGNDNTSIFDYTGQIDVHNYKDLLIDYVFSLEEVDDYLNLYYKTYNVILEIIENYNNLDISRGKIISLLFWNPGQEQESILNNTGNLLRFVESLTNNPGTFSVIDDDIIQCCNKNYGFMIFRKYRKQLVNLLYEYYIEGRHMSTINIDTLSDIIGNLLVNGIYTEELDLTDENLIYKLRQLIYISSSNSKGSLSKYIYDKCQYGVGCSQGDMYLLYKVDPGLLELLVNFIASEISASPHQIMLINLIKSLPYKEIIEYKTENPDDYRKTLYTLSWQIFMTDEYYINYAKDFMDSQDWYDENTQDLVIEDFKDFALNLYNNKQMFDLNKLMTGITGICREDTGQDEFILTYNTIFKDNIYNNTTSQDFYQILMEWEMGLI